MAKRNKFKIGDRVLVIGSPPIKSAPGLRDEMGTRNLFKHMIGRVYTVRGFGRYGLIELHPKRLSSVWIEPEYLELRPKRPKIGARYS
jgi:hypothetical protein